MTTPDLTPERLAEIRARAEAATERPWKKIKFGSEAKPAVVSPAGDAELGNWMVAKNIQWGTDAEFIAHARTDIPDLLAAIEARDAEIERLRLELAGTNPAYEMAVDGQGKAIERVERLEKHMRGMLQFERLDKGARRRLELALEIGNVY